MNLEIYNLKPIMVENLKKDQFIILHNNLVKISYLMEFSSSKIWIFYFYNDIEYNIVKPKNFVLKLLKKNPKIWN